MPQKQPNPTDRSRRVSPCFAVCSPAPHASLLQPRLPCRLFRTRAAVRANRVVPGRRCRRLRLSQGEHRRRGWRRGSAGSAGGGAAGIRMGGDESRRESNRCPRVDDLPSRDSSPLLLFSAVVWNAWWAVRARAGARGVIQPSLPVPSASSPVACSMCPAGCALVLVVRLWRLAFMYPASPHPSRRAHARQRGRLPTRPSIPPPSRPTATAPSPTR